MSFAFGEEPVGRVEQGPGERHIGWCGQFAAGRPDGDGVTGGGVDLQPEPTALLGQGAGACGGADADPDLRGHRWYGVRVHARVAGTVSTAEKV